MSNPHTTTQPTDARPQADESVTSRRDVLKTAAGAAALASLGPARSR